MSSAQPVVFMFPSHPQSSCPLCLRTLASHEVQGRGFRCTRDVVVGRDQQTDLRRARLADVQARVLKVRPWAIDVPEEVVR